MSKASDLGYWVKDHGGVVFAAIMVVAGHEGSDVDPLVNHGRVPVRAPRVRPPVHGHEGGVVLPVPQSPRHHRDVHDTAALFGLRSAHSASAAALLGQNSHIWDDE